nr:hypothetical protein [uncultured Emticicia sp.]
MKQLITIATVLFLLTGINTFAKTNTLIAEQAKKMINKEVIVKANVCIPSKQVLRQFW